MIISVMENTKCSILSQQHTETWSTGEAGGSLGHEPADLEGMFYSHIKQESGSFTSSDSGSEGKWGKYENASCCICHVHPLCLKLLE